MLTCERGPAKIISHRVNECNPILTLENYVYEESKICPVCREGIILLPIVVEPNRLPSTGAQCPVCGQRYEIASSAHIRKRRRWKN